MPVSMSYSSNPGSVLLMLPRVPSMIIWRVRICSLENFVSALVTNTVADQFGGKRLTAPSPGQLG